MTQGKKMSWAIKSYFKPKKKKKGFNWNGPVEIN